ncbi:hypothetical protein [Streptococcus orisratti]|nr:hypothetical protein [Streptococcus orisratti]
MKSLNKQVKIAIGVVIAVIVIIGGIFISQRNSIQGTYVGEESGVKETLTIKDDVATLETEGFLANMKLKGKVDRGKKEIKLKGTYFGIDTKMTFLYKKMNSDKIQITDKERGDSIVLEKEK